MAKTRQQKEDLVKALRDKLGRAKSVIFVDYKGLTMKQLSELRNKLLDVNAEFTITKNTLLQRALPTSLPIGGPQLPNSNFEGPTATLFAYDDEVSPLKLLVKMLKDAGLGKVKGGFLGLLAPVPSGTGPAGGDFLDESEILRLSLLPTKNELRTKTVGILVAPLKGLISVLQGNLRNLIYVLSEIQIRRLAEKGGVLYGR